jgi:hypothetical protein
VSACYSLWAGNVFVAAGVPHVVCIRTSDRILEAAALRFTQAFYTSLAAGDSVQEAFNIARKGVESQPELAVGLSHCVCMFLSVLRSGLGLIEWSPRPVSIRGSGQVCVAARGWGS